MNDHPIYSQFLEDYKNKKYPSHWPIELCAFTEFKSRIGALESEVDQLKRERDEWKSLYSNLSAQTQKLLIIQKLNSK